MERSSYGARRRAAEIRSTQQFVDIQFLDTALFGFAYQGVMPLRPNEAATEALIATDVYTPFQSVRLLNNSFGIVSLTKVAAEFVHEFHLDLA